MPFPIEKTKFEIRKAAKKDPKKDPASDKRVPIDISAQSVGTKDGGYKVIVLNQAERDELKRQLAGKTDMRIMETYSVSMEGQVVREIKKN
ncbi:MAG: hypothetical protein Q4E54_07620 [Lachnospiraceae bacterium]|nr:hypothetical protein [Lachnospiraceae bacterium]